MTVMPQGRSSCGVAAAGEGRRPNLHRVGDKIFDEQSVMTVMPQGSSSCGAAAAGDSRRPTLHSRSRSLKSCNVGLKYNVGLSTS
jgi:hypothetical protein